MKKLKLILTVGLPASSKSTWAKQFILDNPEYARVNRDDLRAMLFGMKFSNRNEELVSIIRDHAIIELLKKGRNVIVDETGLNPKTQAQMRKYAEEYNAEFEMKEFDKDVELCILHDMTRPNPVGAKPILRMYEKYIKPKEKKIKHDPNKRNAIISDIDGTIAVLSDRDPYNTSLSYKDELNHVIARTLRSMNEKIVFVTGRDEKYRDLTETWLDKHFEDYELFMRPEGDKRHDYIIKEEITINKILPRYNIILCWDDRPRCSRVYRKLGLQVAHVGLTSEW